MGESVESEVELFTNEVLIGAHVPSVDDPITGKAWITLTGLEEWYDDFHFSGSVAPFPPNPSDPFALTARVRYHAKDSSLFNVVPGRKLKFRSEYHGPVIFRTKKRIEISEQNFLELNFDPAASINDVLYETEIWQYFLAFGRTKPVFFDEFSLLLFDPGRRTARLLVPGRKESASIKPRHPTELLFTRSELGRRLSGCLSRWRENYPRLHNAIRLLMGPIFAEDTFPHLKLLVRLQALEVLHRECFRNTCFTRSQLRSRERIVSALKHALPSDIDSALYRQSNATIGFIKQPTFLDRLSHLYDTYVNSVTPLFPACDEEMRHLRDIRNQLTHHNKTISSMRLSFGPHTLRIWTKRWEFSR